MRRLLWFIAAMSVACSNPNSPTVATPSTTTAPATTTSAEGIVETAASSDAIVAVGGEVIHLHATCYAPGAGDLVAVARGPHPVSGEPVRMLVQAFLGEPYLSVAIGDRLVESSLDEPLLLEVDDGIIRGDQVSFVEGLDLETGDGTPAGLGFVRVECHQFERGLPPGY